MDDPGPDLDGDPFDGKMEMDELIVKKVERCFESGASLR
jgi:hypothetical protein